MTEKQKQPQALPPPVLTPEQLRYREAVRKSLSAEEWMQPTEDDYSDQEMTADLLTAAAIGEAIEKNQQSECQSSTDSSQPESNSAAALTPKSLAQAAAYI